MAWSIIDAGPTLSPFFLYFSFFMLGFILFNHEATIRKYITKPLLVVGFVLMLIAIGFMYMGRAERSYS